MGNAPSDRRKSPKSGKKKKAPEDVASRAQQVASDLQKGIQNGMKKLEENDHPAAQLIDNVCGHFLEPTDLQNNRRSYDSESDEDLSEDETTTTDYQRRRRANKRDEETLESASYLSQSDEYESTVVDSKLDPRRRSQADESSFDTAESKQRNKNLSGGDEAHKSSMPQPLASAFAKRCYFTKSGIGKMSQHYEGLTLTGNVVLMLAAAMKLKGCPTICDEDLRRVEQTYPNQFSRLPDELLLSSGWRRISKYCHFSNKPIPDGVPFFHSRQRLHPTGGYYFLLAASVGMVRPTDVEPLNRDTLVLLETDYGNACDSAPRMLIEEPNEWTLVDRFCFFSGGPINTEEDVYYQADFDGNPIFMLAFLSPSLTPAELYKLDDPQPLASIQAVQEVESIYDLTERDFDDLKLYHLGPCRALPQYVLQPEAWTKVLPPHFIQARETALLRVQEYNQQVHHQAPTPGLPFPGPSGMPTSQFAQLRPNEEPFVTSQNPTFYGQQASPSQEFARNAVSPHTFQNSFSRPDADQHRNLPLQPSPQHLRQSPEVTSGEVQRQMEEEGAFVDNSLPMDEAIAAHAARTTGLDPPEDQPPSLSKKSPVEDRLYPASYSASPMSKQSWTKPAAPSPTMNSVPVPSPRNALHYEELASPAKSALGSVASAKADSRIPRPSDSVSSTPRQYEESLSSPRQRTPQQAPQPSFSYEDTPSLPDDRDDKRTAEGSVYSIAESSKIHVTSPVSDNDMLSPGPSLDSESLQKHSSPELSIESPTKQPISPSSASLPPRSPGSDFSRSSAMKGAQEMLRRNRQRRLQEALKVEPDAPEDDEPSVEPPVASPDSEAGGTWESSSEVTSIVSGSSVWTDNTNPDRSSRRALILQMAKARMRNNKASSAVASPTSQDTSMYEEKKLEVHQAEDIDLAGELD